MSRRPKPLIFIPVETTTELEIPLAGDTVQAGFPSPAQDYSQEPLDLNRELVKNPLSTFYARVSGDSMEGEGIAEGDLLVVDKSIEPYDGCLALCFIDGEFTLKRVRAESHHLLLLPANPRYRAIKVTEENEFLIWGIVTYSIRKH